MSARLVFFVLRQRLSGRSLFVTAAFGIVSLVLVAELVRAIAFPQYTLTVVDYNLNPSTGNTMYLYAGDHLVTQASVFNGTVQANGIVRFHLSPGDYKVYVTRGMLDTGARPSGKLLSASVSIHLVKDTQIDFMQEANIVERGP